MRIEALFLLVVPRWGFFRHAVDKCLDEADRAAVEKVREGLVLAATLVGASWRHHRRREGRSTGRTATRGWW